MYRFQGGTNRSNGIYCEPENPHFSSPHVNKKSSKMRHHHRVTRSNNRSQHLPHSRNDTSMDSEADSSSEVSDGTYQDSDTHAGMTMPNRLNITQNGTVNFYFLSIASLHAQALLEPLKYTRRSPVPYIPPYFSLYFTIKCSCVLWICEREIAHGFLNLTHSPLHFF